MSNRIRALIAFMAFATVFLVMVGGLFVFLFSSWLPYPTSIDDLPGAYEGPGPEWGSMSLVLDRRGTYVQKIRTASGRSLEATGVWHMMPESASRGQELELDWAWKPSPDYGQPPPSDGYRDYLWNRTRLRLDLYYSPRGPILRAVLAGDDYDVNLYPQ